MKQSAYVAIAIILATVFAFMGSTGSAADILATGADGDSSTTNSASGLEIIGGDITVFRGCADSELISWDETADKWECAAAGGAATITVDDDDVEVSAVITHLDFGTNLDAAESPSGEANITITDPFTIGAIIDAGTIALRPSGDNDDYFSFATTGNIPTIYGTGSYLRIGDGGTEGHLAPSEDDILITGAVEIDGQAWFDGGAAFYGQGEWASDALRLYDNVELEFGNDADATIYYHPGDANAKLLKGWMNGTKDANNVPVFIWGDETIWNLDLGGAGIDFSGYTQPHIAIADDDADSYMALGFLSDDFPLIRTDGNTFDLAVAGQTTRSLRLQDTNSVVTLLGRGAYLRIGDAATTSRGLSSEDDLFVSGAFEVDGLADFDGSTDFNSFANFKSDLGISDSAHFKFGTTGGNAMTRLFFSVQDADAEYLVYRLSSLSTHIPALMIGDPSIGADEGIADGLTQPTIFVVEKDWKYQASSTGTCDGADLDELTEAGAFGSAVIGDVVRITAGTNVTTGWYWIDDVTDANNVNLDRDYCSGASADTTYLVYHDFTMLSADGISTRITDGAPSDSSVEIDRDGWMILDVGQANGRLYWRANNAWHYVDATAGVSLPAEERIDPYGHTFEVGDTVEFVVDRINADGSYHAYPVWPGKTRNLVVTTTTEEVKVGEDTDTRDVEVVRPVIVGTKQVAVWNEDTGAYDTVTEDVYQTELVPVYEAVWNDKTQSYDTAQKTRWESETQIVQELQQVARMIIVKEPKAVAIGLGYEIEWVDVEVAQTTTVVEDRAVWNEITQTFDKFSTTVKKVIYDEVLVDVEVEVQIEVPVFEDRIVYETVTVKETVTVPIFETRVLYETTWAPPFGP